MNVFDPRFPCPCCGHLIFRKFPGSYDICRICFWEDDLSQLRWPDSAGGANRPSLIEAQKNYALFGATEERYVGLVRPPNVDELLDEGWRPADPQLDSFERKDGPRESGPDDYTTFYWWRPTFWRRSK